MRQNFSVGQEFVSEDINSLQSRLERGIYDRIIYQLMGRRTDAFFKDSFNCLFQTSVTVTVKQGLGFQVNDTGTKHPIKKPLVLDADVNVTIDTPDGSNPRIDIICVKNNRYNAEAENRKFKDEFSDTITTLATTVATDWLADVNYVVGTPAGSPVAPATPVGYLLISSIYVTASTGIANQAAITDERDLLPFANATSDTGSSEYDAIVGTVGVDQGANYSTLKAALDNAVDGWKILVLRSETISSTPIVLTNKTEIIFKPGVSFTKGTSNIGLQINGNDCRVHNGRFVTFNTVGDFGIKVNTGALRAHISGGPRFLTCDGNINDLGTNTFIDVEFTE